MEPADKNPLLLALRSMIDRRQATVRSGEMPYRPQIRFQVYPDGFRAYYLAYPALELLQVPMTRDFALATDIFHDFTLSRRVPREIYDHWASDCSALIPGRKKYPPPRTVTN